MTERNALISSYTRAQAIADGVLIDVSKLAKQEAGFFFPVAVTAAVWAECVAVPDGVAGQLESTRLWNVLNVLRFAIASQKRDGERVDFAVHVRNDNRDGEPSLVPLYALCGPGDNGEPVITVMRVPPSKLRTSGTWIDSIETSPLSSNAAANEGGKQ